MLFRSADAIAAEILRLCAVGAAVDDAAVDAAAGQLMEAEAEVGAAMAAEGDTTCTR